MASGQKQPLSPDAWLAQVVEEPLEPALPIVDPHHHLWDHPNNRYMLDEILRDTGTGHRVIATVFVKCLSMYRAEGPESLKPVGETEFVNGIAAQSASGQYGETRVAAGIVSFADLNLGGAVEEVLRAHIAAAPARFRGIRHAGGFDPEPPGKKFAYPPYRRSVSIGTVSRGFWQAEALQPEFRSVAVPSADAAGNRSCQGFSRYDDHPQSFWWATWHRSLQRPGRGDFPSMEGRHHRTRTVLQRRRETRGGSICQ